MGFWLKFAKKVIDNAIADALASGTRREHKPARCAKCGRSYPPEALVNGECVLCRTAERHRQQEHSRGSGTQERRGGNDLEEAYRILGCSETDSDDDIKRRYRKLVKECHVDSLPKGLPDYLVQAANLRFREVRDAYEKIMNSRDSRN